jgi:hypothetical protein
MRLPLHCDERHSAATPRLDVLCWRVAVTSYIYELRQGETVVATGHINHDPPLEVGQHLVINKRDGLVQAIDPTIDPREHRLVIQLLHDDL